jgi:formylglycine-generating enzyme
MPLNKTFITILLFIAASSFSVICSAQSSKKSRIRPVIPYNHPTLIAPPGMVYVPSGSTKINYSQSSTDTNSYRKVSLSAFFIDKTEVTNQQYRQFVNWVIDSIAIVTYLKDDKYFIQKESKSSDAGKGSATSTPAPAAPVAVDSAGRSLDTSRMAGSIKASDSSIKKRIDWSKVDHDKIWDTKDEETRGKLQPMLDENGNIKKEFYIFNFTYLRNVGSTNTKAKKNIYVTEPLNIYPNEKVWAEDLANSSTDLYVENYFKAPPFDDYPVVGVNWLQARAFCYWRSLTASHYYNMPEYMKYYHFIYNLPSEGQWVYAAQGYYDMISDNNDTLKRHKILLPSDSTVTPHDSAFVAAMLQNNAEDSSYNAGIDDRKKAAVGNLYVADYLSFKKRKKASYKIDGAPVDSTPIHRDSYGLLSNFKQDEGDYTEDGAALTLPVMAFAPNEFGIYNMEGNVSEWVLDAYSPSAFSFVSDLNPALLYDADSTDADAMKRKVIRGGSFMSNANALSPYYRDLELQNVSHCYLGFRCVVQAPEIIRKDVKTRSKTFKGKKSEGKFSHFRLPEIR